MVGHIGVLEQRAGAYKALLPCLRFLRRLSRRCGGWSHLLLIHSFTFAAVEFVDFRQFRRPSKGGMTRLDSVGCLNRYCGDGHDWNDLSPEDRSRVLVQGPLPLAVKKRLVQATQGPPVAMTTQRSVQS